MSLINENTDQKEVSPPFIKELKQNHITSSKHCLEDGILKGISNTFRYDKAGRQAVFLLEAPSKS